MRTLLIPLLLICSLTQFVNAAAKKGSDYECGSLYRCVIPEICEVAGPAAAMDSTKGVKPADANTDIADDCPAIFRYHLYAEYWMHVSIESLKGTADIKSIQFVQKDANKKQKMMISCELEKDPITGKEFITGMHGKRIRFQNDKPGSTLKCEFNAKALLRKSDSSKTTESILEEVLEDPNGSDYHAFIINGDPTGYTKFPYPRNGLDDSTFCDPSDLQFYGDKTDKLKHEKIYDKIKSDPGKYYCADYFEIQYREDGQEEPPEGEEPVSKTITKITCNMPKFNFDGEDKPSKATYSVRCAADVKYFCDYDVKIKQGEISPIRVKPSWNPKRESSLKCPPEKPHLIVVKERSEKQIPNAKIECRKYGADQFWTVDGEILYEDGPEVYCTDTVECNRIHKIPASSVKNGFLDKKDFLPRCHKGGELYVDDKKVLSKECDSTDGKFKYSVKEGVKLNIDEGTKFVCKYL